MHFFITFLRHTGLDKLTLKSWPQKNPLGKPVGCNSLRGSVLVPHVLGEDQVLALLAHARDAELLAGQSVPKLGGWLATHHTQRTSHGESAAATKDVEGEIVLEGIHSVHYLHTVQDVPDWVNRYFELFQGLAKKRTDTLCPSACESNVKPFRHHPRRQPPEESRNCHCRTAPCATR